MAEEKTGSPPTWKQRLTLYGYKALCAFLRICDIRLVALFGRCIGYLVWAAMPSRRRTVARNLRIILDPTLRPHQMRAMVRRNMVRTTMNLSCSLKTGLMTDKEEARAIRMEGADIFEKNGSDGHTVISCIPHAGNWEILARIRPHFKKVEHFGSMYRRLSNPLLEDFVYRSRTRYGCEMHSKEDGLKAVLKLARTGGLLGVLSDQFTYEGLYLPYFGKVTGVTPLPALLYKRCKGKGTLHSVFTRNTGLGKWDAVLGRVIELPEGCDGVPAITMQVNLALERCQRENILDGFWMHHRWKPMPFFAMPQPEGVLEECLKYTKLPFRFLFCMPEEFEEAAILLPILRAIKTSRFDAELTVICPMEQAKLWEAQDVVTNVVVTDGEKSPLEQLESDELYKNGPYDYLFMFSDNKRVFKNLLKLDALFTSTFAENPLTRKFRFRACSPTINYGNPQHRIQDYVYLLKHAHGYEITPDTSPAKHNSEATGAFIAPFSTLGAADCWPEERWAELASRLPQPPTLLALPQNEGRANSMAEKLGIACRIVLPHEVADVVGPNTRLYAVDGLLPQLAAMAGCPCTVIMASRLKERYAPLGEGHKVLFNHRPCHPCYRKDCDMQQHCTASITVDDMLA